MTSIMLVTENKRLFNTMYTREKETKRQEILQPSKLVYNYIYTHML